MGNKQINNPLKDQHPVSIKGIFNKYIFKKLCKSPAVIIGGIIASLVVSLLWFNDSKHDMYYSLLSQMVDWSLSLFPNLLGFCIGGYALIIGAANLDVLSRMSEPLCENKDNNISLYQVMSSIFAASIIIQCFTLFIVYLFRIIINIEISIDPGILGKTLNMSAIFVIVFLTISSIVLLYYTVINIFNFGQMTHFCVRLDKQNKKSAQNDKQRE